jgi:hypothetical protein
MDYGFAIGGGLEYEREKGIWILDLRYDYSVLDTHTDDAIYNSNRTLGISITYIFDFVDFYKRMKDKKKSKENSTNPESNTQTIK